MSPGKHRPPGRQLRGSAEALGTALGCTEDTPPTRVMSCSPAACSTSRCLAERVPTAPIGAVIARTTDIDGSRYDLLLADVAAGLDFADRTIRDDPEATDVQLVERTATGWQVIAS